MINADNLLSLKFIRISLVGFTDQVEKDRLSRMFSQANSGLQRWQMVEQPSAADMLLVLANQEEELVVWLAEPYRFTTAQLIAYAYQPLANAQWHFPRPSANRPPSSLDFFRLISKINEKTKAKQPLQMTPILSTESTQHTSIATTLKPAKQIATTSIHNLDSIKILFVGSTGSGKTTAIQTLANGKLLTTEVTPSDQTQFLKKTTTVAMDYASVEFEPQRRLHIYGAPGQRRFDFMGDILSHNAKGLVILISNASSHPFVELNYYLNRHQGILTQCPAVIGVTHNDINPKPSLREYCQFLEEVGSVWPVFKVDARSKIDMLKLIDALSIQQPASTLGAKAIS